MRRTAALLLTGALLTLAACADEAKEPSSGSGADGGELIVQVASYEVLAGEEQRVLLGLLLPDQRFVSQGTVDVEFFYLGTEEGRGKAQPGPEAEAGFLSIPGTSDHHAASEVPVAAPASQGRGVYAAYTTFDRVGFWSAQVTADVADEGKLTGNSVFEVVENGPIPAVGEPAPKTDNLTIDSKDAPIGAVDSRAASGGKVPDPALHQITIAESIRRGEPALVVFATPVYCVSRFCGPITDMVEDLERAYGDRANFIHVEIWRNYKGQVINKGAADWLYHGGDLTEPWIFLIDAEGRVAARWDNVATPAEIEPFLKELPRK